MKHMLEFDNMYQFINDKEILNELLDNDMSNYAAITAYLLNNYKSLRSTRKDINFDVVMPNVYLPIFSNIPEYGNNLVKWLLKDVYPLLDSEVQEHMASYIQKTLFARVIVVFDRSFKNDMDVYEYWNERVEPFFELGFAPTHLLLKEDEVNELTPMLHRRGIEIDIEYYWKQSGDSIDEDPKPYNPDD